MCLVPTRGEWVGRSDHFYKQNSLLKVKGVPTVVLINNGDVVARASSDEEFANDELLAMIAKPE